jgi:hypothetical protein
MPDEPTDADRAAMLAAIGDVMLSEPAKAKLLDGLWGIHVSSEAERRMERFSDRKARLRNRDALKSTLSRALEVLSDEVAFFDVWDGFPGEIFAAAKEIENIMAGMRRILDVAEAFNPIPSRKGRGEEQFRTYIARQQDFQLVELLESVDLRVGATGGNGGPGSRLMARLRTWLEHPRQTVRVQSPDTAKRVIRGARRRR